MNRRELLGLAAASAAAAAAGSLPGAAEAASEISSGRARRLWIDGCGEAFDVDGKFPPGEAALAALAASNLAAVNFTVVGPGADFEKTVRAIAFVQGAAARRPDRLLVVRGIADLGRAAAEGKVGLIMGFQTTGMLGDDLGRIDVFGRLGVRIMQLTYNDRSLYGDGCLEPSDAGLSRLGRQAVERMNASGITVDVSHSGDRTTREAIEASGKPIVISHAGCRAVFPHPRNKEDAALKSLAGRGGVVGIYLMPFLSAGPGPITPDDLYRHVAHALSICGEDHVGIGTDQGIEPIADTPEYRKALAAEVETRRKAGVGAPGESADRPPFIPEFNRVDRFSRLADDFARRGMPSSVIDKVLGRNFERVFEETWRES
jgi:membrane dipeptidase